MERPTISRGMRSSEASNVDKRQDHGKPHLISPFSSPHNSKITWDHLLRQTSDWEGTLWGKPDWADRPNDKPLEWLNRKRNEPGTVYKYNDTRVNALALAATAVWHRSLPEVLRERIMEPIGASNSWHWTCILYISDAADVLIGCICQCCGCVELIKVIRIILHVQHKFK